MDSRKILFVYNRGECTVTLSCGNYKTEGVGNTRLGNPDVYAECGQRVRIDVRQSFKYSRR